jgi:hypothetical protein
LPDIIPFSADILTRVTKYVKQGGSFVCGGYRFPLNVPADPFTGRSIWTIWRGTVGQADDGNKRITWSQVFEEQRGMNYFPYAGAYGLVGADPAADPPKPGKPTFVMAGIEQFFDPTGSSYTGTSILTSFDGSSWKQTYGNRTGQAYAAAWDGANKRFLVQGLGNVGVGDYTHVVYASGDGLSWSQIETKPGLGQAQIQPSSLLTATGTPLVKDVDGNIVPNGSYFGLNKDVMIIAPPADSLNPYNPAGVGGLATAAIEIIKQEVDSSTGQKKITRSNRAMLFDVFSVAFAGGIYVACGRNEDSLTIASSKDEGLNWNIDLILKGYVATCVLASPDLAK